MTWQTGLARVTVFPQRGSSTGWNPLSWGDLIDEEPEQRVVRREIEVSEGPFDKGRLHLSLKNLPDRRLDLVYRSTQEVGENDQIASLGDLSEVLEVFGPFCLKLLTEDYICGRIAFAVNQFEPYGSLEEALTGIGPRVDARFDLSGAHEFAYHINRRRTSTVVESLEINRVSNWSVDTLTLMILEKETGRAAPGGKVVHAAALSTDLNTDGGFEGVLEPQERAALFEELSAQTFEISEKGDIP